MTRLQLLRLGIAAGVIAALAYTLGRIEWAAVGRVIASARPQPLLFAALGVVMPLGARSLRAGYLLRRTGYRQVPPLRIAAVTVYGFSLSSLTPGGSGDLLRVAALRPYGVSTRTSAALVVLERLLDVGVMAALLVVALAASLGGTAQGVGAASGMAAALAVGAGLYARWRPDPQRLARALPERARRFLPDGDAARALLAPRTIVTSFGFTVLVFASEALRPWWVLQALGFDVGFFGAWSVFTLAWLAGLLSLLPLGVGSWETAAVWAFGLYGIGPSEGAAGALLLRAGVTVPALAAGVLALFVLRRSVLGESAGSAETGGGVSRG
jgi:Mg2+-importing ATPase